MRPGVFAGDVHAVHDAADVGRVAKILPTSGRFEMTMMFCAFRGFRAV